MKPTLFLLALALVVTACKKDDNNPPNNGGTGGLTLPATYGFTDYLDNTTDARAVADSLSSLASAMQVGRNSANTVSSDDLTAIFTGGTLSLSDITEPAFRDSVNAWITTLANSSGRAYDTTNVPNTEGGALAGYLFDGNGTELEQLIEKGLFSAALYRRALLNHLNGNVTAADIDNAFVYYGANVDFPNTNVDMFSARYAARRDNGGFYTNLKTHFLTARVAIAENRTAELTAAIAGIKDQWEKALAATVINYLYSTADRLNNENVPFSVKGGAWHAWGEAVGFLYGLRALPESERRITTAEINTVLELISAKPRAIWDVSTPTQLANFNTAINNIAAIYSFADPSIFRRNDVNDRNPNKTFGIEDEE